MESKKNVIEPIYDRVTAVLSPFTGVEFVDKNLLETAGDRGTRVHNHIEGYLNGWGFGDTDSEVEPYLESFKLFWEGSSHIFKDGKIILEDRMYCHDKKITGKADVVIKNKHRTYLIDWKTSSIKHKSWAQQGAAYRYLCEINEDKNVDVDAVLFVKLLKSGKAPTLYKDENYKENLEIFFKCLELYRYFDMKNTRQRRT